MTLLAKNTPSGNTSTFVMLANIATSDEIGADELTGKTREEVMGLFTFFMPDKGNGRTESSRCGESRIRSRWITVPAPFQNSGPST